MLHHFETHKQQQIPVRHMPIHYAASDTNSATDVNIHILDNTNTSLEFWSHLEPILQE